MGRPCKHYIGETFTANNGMKFTIINIDRTSKKPFTIQFEDGYTTSVFDSVLKNEASVRNPNTHKNKSDIHKNYNSISEKYKNVRIGEQIRHRDGNLMTIIEYKNSDSVLVVFEDGSTVKTTYKSFKVGSVQHPKLIFGKFYKSIEEICKTFNISRELIKDKSNIEIENYIVDH